MKKPTETALVRQCLDLLALCGVFAFRVNTTGVFDPARKVFRTFQGLKGVADILGVLPYHRDPDADRLPGAPGRFLAVETKCGHNDLTTAQSLFGDRVQDEGGIYLVVRDVAELQAWLQGADLWKE